MWLWSAHIPEILTYVFIYLGSIVKHKLLNTASKQMHWWFTNTMLMLSISKMARVLKSSLCPGEPLLVKPAWMEQLRFWGQGSVGRVWTAHSYSSPHVSTLTKATPTHQPKQQAFGGDNTMGVLVCLYIVWVVVYGNGDFSLRSSIWKWGFQIQ